MTGAFKNSSFARLLNELGWDSLEDRRKLARLSLFKKMTLSAQFHKDGNVNERSSADSLSGKGLYQ